MASTKYMKGNHKRNCKHLGKLINLDLSFYNFLHVSRSVIVY
jgi:hypothetical protein